MRWPSTPELVRGMTGSLLTSTVGTAINLATDWKDNPIAWIVVIVLTAAAGIFAPGVEVGANRGSAVRKRRARLGDGSEFQSEESVPLMVMRKVVETRRDGTRIERTEYFSELIALHDRDLSEGPATSGLEAES